MPLGNPHPRTRPHIGGRSRIAALLASTALPLAFALTPAQAAPTAPPAAMLLAQTDELRPPLPEDAPPAEAEAAPAEEPVAEEPAVQAPQAEEAPPVEEAPPAEAPPVEAPPPQAAEPAPEPEPEPAPEAPVEAPAAASEPTPQPPVEAAPADTAPDTVEEPATAQEPAEEPVSEPDPAPAEATTEDAAEPAADEPVADEPVAAEEPTVEEEPAAEAEAPVEAEPAQDAAPDVEPEPEAAPDAPAEAAPETAPETDASTAPADAAPPEPAAAAPTTETQAAPAPADAAPAGAPAAAAAPDAPPSAAAVEAMLPEPVAPQADGLQGFFGVLEEGARALGEVRRAREERVIDGRTVIVEPGSRTIYREGDRYTIVNDEQERLRRYYDDVRVIEDDGQRILIAERPGGYRVITVVDEWGNLVRRVRQAPDGTETVLIDNRRDRFAVDRYTRDRRSYGDDAYLYDYSVALPPPRIEIPYDLYVVELDDVPVTTTGSSAPPPPRVLEAFTAPPVATPPRAFTLDEVRYNENLRDYMRRVDLDVVTFPSGEWRLTQEQVAALEPVADAMRQVLREDLDEIFLVEGHTDAVGAEIDNLSLSDRRAETVAYTLSEAWGIPPENLVTQGYGEEYLKVPTEEAERRNRRVTLRRITPLIEEAQQR